MKHRSWMEKYAKDLERVPLEEALIWRTSKQSIQARDLLKDLLSNQNAILLPQPSLKIAKAWTLNHDRKYLSKGYVNSKLWLNLLSLWQLKVLLPWILWTTWHQNILSKSIISFKCLSFRILGRKWQTKLLLPGVSQSF